MVAYPKVETAFNASVNDAIRSGALDPKAHGAAIAAARKLAKVLDAPGWPEMPSGKVDNVTPTTFLRYCEALGIVPQAASQPKRQENAVSELRSGVLRMKAS